QERWPCSCCWLLRPTCFTLLLIIFAPSGHSFVISNAIQLGTTHPLPCRRWWWGYDWRTVVAGDGVREFPGSEPGAGRTASCIAAEVSHAELRACRGKMEGTTVVDPNRSNIAGYHILKRRISVSARAQH